MRKLILTLFIALIPTFAIAQELTFDDYYIQAKENVARIQEKISGLENTVMMQREDIEGLQEDVDRLITQIDRDTEEIAEKGQKIIEQNEKLKMQRKWLIICSGVFCLFFLVHMAVFFIALKWNIKLPYWLNAII
jgi:peptidoglycan hydrolase CwlO-like protein